MPVIRVLVVSDIRLYREGLALVLDRNERMRVTAACANVADAMALESAALSDAFLLDMASADAFAGIRQISDRFPRARIVALGVGRRDSDVIACAEAGIAGYVFRDASIEELVATVESAVRGELRCTPDVAATLLRRVAVLAEATDASIGTRLTRREWDIVRLIEHGMSNKEIAARLCIEIATVKNHIHNLLEKLGARTRAEAAAKLRLGSRDGSRMGEDARVE